MIRGLFRFGSLFLPKSWLEYWLPRQITDFSKPYILSRSQKIQEEKRQREKQGYEQPSQTQEQIKQKLEKARLKRQQLRADPWKIVVKPRPWREEKQQWDYFYLQGVKSWRTRGRLQKRIFNADVPWNEVMYFPELSKFIRRVKRFNKKTKQRGEAWTKMMGEKLKNQSIFKSAPISESQAYMILNLEPPAQGYPELEVIWQRYQTLSKKNATSIQGGGSTYLQSKIQSAKDHFLQKIEGGKQFEQRKIDESGVIDEMKRIQKQQQMQMPEWLIELEAVEDQIQLQAQAFAKDVQNGRYIMPKWFQYRFYKVKQMDIRYKLQQKKLMQEDKKRMMQRKRKQKQIRLIIQQLQDKVDKIVAEGGDTKDIVFPELPKQQPSLVKYRVQESEDQLLKQLQRVQNVIKQKFPDFKVGGIEGYQSQSQIMDEDFEVKLQFDYDHETGKDEIIVRKY